MAKILYPPIVNQTIPAFYPEQGIIVPFRMNKAVSIDEISGMKIKIMTVSTNKELDAFRIARNNITHISEDNYKLLLNLGANNEVWSRLTSGEFYKIQICFINENNEYGYWSSVAIAKYTQKPELSVAASDNTFTGNYENVDSSEKLYSYQFNLYDKNDKLIDTSGEHFCNSEHSIAATKMEVSWISDQVLLAEKQYRIELLATTVNNISLSASQNVVGTPYALSKDVGIIFWAELLPEVGGALLKIQRSQDTISAISCNFVVYRSCSKDNYETEIQIVKKGSIMSQELNQPMVVYKDLTLEHGYTYKYSFVLVNDYGAKILPAKSGSVNVVADFEHMYLFDGERQLCIKFNPKISSFKNTILEQKIDTLGGTHPIFFRNGNVKYKEFPISGLISMLMDDNELFARSRRPVEAAFVSTNLTGENYKLEHDFKMEVLEWLTNGKPKLFRSPQEGNYIVRLMNTSLSPNDTLGRMLHTFSCTAYEIAENNFTNLKKYGILQEEVVKSESQKTILGIRSIKLSNAAYWTDWEMTNGNDGAVISRYITNKIVYAYLTNGTEGTSFEYVIGNTTYQGYIGKTGEYHIPSELFAQGDKNYFEIKKISGTKWNEAILIVGYHMLNPNDSFQDIARITYSPTPQYAQRVYYPLKDSEGNIIEDSNGHNLIPSLDVLVTLDPAQYNPIMQSNTQLQRYEQLRNNYLGDIRRSVGKVYYLRISSMPCVPIYINGGKPYLDAAYTIQLDQNKPNLLRNDTLYVGKDGEDKYHCYWANLRNTYIFSRVGLTPYQCIVNDTNYDFMPQVLSDGSIPFTPKRIEGDIILRDLDSLSSLIITPGIKIEILYQEINTYYTFEDLTWFNAGASLLGTSMAFKNSEYPAVVNGKWTQDYQQEYFRYYSDSLFPRWYKNIYLKEKSQLDKEAVIINTPPNLLRRPQYASIKPYGIKYQCLDSKDKPIGPDSGALASYVDRYLYTKAEGESVGSCRTQDGNERNISLITNGKLRGVSGGARTKLYWADTTSAGNTQIFIIYVKSTKQNSPRYLVINKDIDNPLQINSNTWTRVVVNGSFTSSIEKCILLELYKYTTNSNGPGGTYTPVSTEDNNDTFKFWRPQLYKFDTQSIQTIREEAISWYELS